MSVSLDGWTSNFEAQSLCPIVLQDLMCIITLGVPNFVKVKVQGVRSKEDLEPKLSSGTLRQRVLDIE